MNEVPAISFINVFEKNFFQAKTLRREDGDTPANK